MRWIALFLTLALHAESGHDAWLRYEPLVSPPQLPAVVSVGGHSLVLRTAQQDLIRGVRGMTGRILRAESGTPRENAIVLQTSAAGLAPDRGVLTECSRFSESLRWAKPIANTVESPRVAADGRTTKSASRV